MNSSTSGSEKGAPNNTSLISGLLLTAILAAVCPSPETRAQRKTEKQTLPPSAAAAAKKPEKKNSRAPFPNTADWVNLFDGKTLQGWAISDFSGHGEVHVADGKLILGNGVMTGVTWTNDIPRMNFEVELDAMRRDGSDFFCGLTFPVGESPCSFIVGGWGGGVVGLSSIDGEDAANNETTKYLNFEKGRWYHIRLRVTQGTIECWIDDEKVVNVDTTGHTLSIRSEVEPSKPFGIATWSTTGAVKAIKVTRVKK